MNPSRWSYEIGIEHNDSPKRLHLSNDVSTLGEPMMSKKPKKIEIPYNNDTISNPEQEKTPQSPKKLTTLHKKYSDFDYSNYDRNDNLVIVQENEKQMVITSNRKCCMWTGLVFLMLAAIANAVYWSVIQ